MIAGGGTGGHISPGIAIADAIEKAAPGTEVYFMGRAGSIEERLVGRTGRGFVAVPSMGLRRSADLRNLAVPFAVVAGFAKALSSLAARRPAVAVGTGGFVSLPPMLAARTLGVPVVLQEQNSYPGLATRVMSRWAACVHTSFEETEGHLPRARDVRLSGNPVRGEFETAERDDARRRLGIPSDATVVLLFGGSRGARRINSALREAAGALGAAGFTLISQTGEDDLESVTAALRDAGVPATVKPFFDDMATVYAACDLVVSRSGASTLAETMLMGRPSILVPYPFATEGHQMKNARAVENAGAAIVIPDEELTGERLATEVARLLNDTERLALMAERARALARPDAAERVAESVLALGLSRSERETARGAAQ